MAKLNVWPNATVQQAQREGWRRPLGCRWVIVDNRDPQRPEVRCRLVVQETTIQSTTATGDMGAVFAAMPPSEWLRLICSLVMSSEHKIVPRVLDRRSRPDSHYVITRKVSVRLLEDGPRSQAEDICGECCTLPRHARDPRDTILELPVTKSVTAQARAAT